MRIGVVCVVLMVLGGCSRDLSLPPPPGPTPPGTVYGRVVYAEPGASAKLPAVGATVQILSSSISAVADDEGRFLLSGIAATSGAILIRYGAQSDGTYARQKLIRLEQVGAGPGRDISLGDVTVAENALIRGKLLRGNISTPSGHVGSTVFVPEGPFTAQTADDGSFELPNLPEGTLSLVFFRQGYVPQTLNDISVQSGESLSLRTISLELDPTPQQPGSLAGTVSFSPPLGDASATTIEASDGQSSPITVNADSAGGWRFVSIQPGLYTLSFRHSDYTPVAVPNLLVTSGGQLVLANVVLTQGPAIPEADAGVQPIPDGGSGGDGGLNANLPPIAKPGLPQVVRTKDPVQLSGAGSQDPEGEPLRYLWEDVSDAGITISPNNTLAAWHPTFVAPAFPTTVTVRLTVTDPEGLSDTALTQIDVVRAPTAQISPSSLSLHPGETGFLSGGGSTDPSNLPLSYDWSVDQTMLPLTLTSLADGGVSVTAPNASGIGRVTLVVRNELVESFPTSVDVTVSSSSVLTASAGADQTAGFGAQVTLQATASSNNPNDLISYSWTQLSGATVSLSGSSSAQASFTAPSTADVLTFRVTASISGGQSTTDDVSVTVLDNVAPTATALDPVGSGIGSPLYATLQFSKSMDTASVENASTVYVTGPSGTVPATVKYDSATRIARVSYLTPLTASATYTLHVDGATDDTPNHNALTAWTSTFTARAFQTTLFSETTPSYSAVAIHPWIARTPVGVYAIGQLLNSNWCSNQTSAFGVKVDEANTQLQVVSALGTLCQTSGAFADWGPKAASAGTLWIHSRDGGSGNYYYRLVGSSFVRVNNAFEHLTPHGNAMFTGHLFAASGAAQLYIYPQDPVTLDFSYTASAMAAGDCSASDIYGLSGEGDGVNLYMGCYRPSKNGTGVFFLQGNSWTELSNLGQTGNIGIGRARIRVHKGLPVVTQAESIGGVWSVNAYRASTNSASTTFTRLGGAAVNPSNSVTVFDSAVLGDELFVAYLDGNQVFVRRTDLLGSGTWTDVPGPNTGGTMNVNLSCLADRPSLDSGPEGVWLSWAEGCGGTPSWQTLVRKVY